MGRLLGRSEAGDKALSDALVQHALTFPGVRSGLKAESCVLFYPSLGHVPVTLGSSFTLSLSLSSLEWDYCFITSHLAYVVSSA